MTLDPIEAEECLKRLVYCIDTREQPTKSLAKRMEYLQPNVRETLNAGDYTAKTLLPDGTWFYVPSAVERKMSLTEIAGNLTRERDRFKAEFNRASERGIRLYILIEQASWEAAYSGAYRSQMKPQSMIASLLTWSARYGCSVLMCERSETGGKLIRDILRYEMREALNKMIE
jgi:ERCC4-type nuclease